MPKHQSEEVRRQQILEAAATCVSKFGYHQTSVDTIAKEAKLSKGAIYWYYDSKEDILIALSEWRWALNLKYVRDISASVTTCKEFLDVLVAATSDYFMQAAFEHRAVHELNAMAMENEKLNSIVAHNGELMREEIASVIKRAIRSGELSKKTKPLETAMEISCLIDGYSVHAPRTDKKLLISSFKRAFDNLYTSLK